MEEAKRDHFMDETSETFILQFKPSTGFTIVFQFPCLKDLLKHQQLIEKAGFECTRLKKFNVKFDHADIALDLRNPHTACDFDLDDYL